MLFRSNWNYYNIWTSNLPDNSCLGIARDTTGVLWLASPAYGLAAYVGGFAFLTFNTVSSGIQSNSSTCIGYNRVADQVWIGSNDSGVICKEGLMFHCYNTSNSPMPDNFIQCVVVDAMGIVWVGTQMGGLVRIDASVLSSIPVVPSDKEIRIYPNPVSDLLTIPIVASEIHSLAISDSRGREVRDISMQFENKNPVVDVSRLDRKSTRLNSSH